MKYTKNEQAVFNVIAQYSMEGGVADINDVVNSVGAELNYSAKQIRGVIASLVKKNKVMVDEYNPSGSTDLYWPIHSQHGPCFWTDYVIDGEEEFITDDEVETA